MSEWMKHLSWKHIVVSGLIYSVVAVLFQQIEVYFTMKYYTDPALAGLWSKVMMPVAGPPPLSFFVVSLLFTVSTGIVLAAVFDYMKGLFGKGYWKRVIGFTDIMVGLSIVFGYFPMYLMFNVPVGLIAAWLISGFFTTLLSAMVFAKKLK